MLMIFESIAKELGTYGENITITGENGQVRVKGIIEPLLYKNKMYLGGSQLATGFFDRGHYLLICPPCVNIPTTGTVLFETEDNKYLLKRSERVRANSQDVYVWAVLCPYTAPSEEEFYDC